MKMLFAKTVKYAGEIKLANVKFDVDEKDVEALKQAGGWVVDEPKPVEPKSETEEPLPVPVVKPKPGPKPKVVKEEEAVEEVEEAEEKEVE